MVRNATRLVNRFGPPVIAAFGIGMRIDQFAFLPALSLGGAVSAFVAQAIGASKPEQIPEILRWAALIALGFAAFFFVLINAMPAQIAGIFTHEAAGDGHTVRFFRIGTFSYFGFALMFARSVQVALENWRQGYSILERPGAFDGTEG